MASNYPTPDAVHEIDQWADDYDDAETLRRERELDIADWHRERTQAINEG